MLATRQALRERLARKRARDSELKVPGHRKEGFGQFLRDLWESLVEYEMWPLWQMAGVLALVGRGMGIDTRDPRLPGWTGLNKRAGAPDSLRKAKKKPRR